MSRLETIWRAIGFTALAGALILALGGVTAVRADSPEQPVDASVEAPAPERVNANFEDFVDFMRERQGTGSATRRVESAGPACGARSDAAVIASQQAAIARAQAQIRAEMQEREAAGHAPDVVMLNNRGYNYAPADAPQPGQAPGPIRPGSPEPQTY